MANVGTVTFDLAAEAAKLRSELEKVRRDVAGLGRTGRDMGNALTSGFDFARKALGAFGIAFGGAALVQGFVRVAGAAVELGDEIGKAAAKAGIAASTMSQLAYAAKQNDVEITSLSTSIRKMQELTSSAADGNKAATQTITSLGLSVEALRQMRPEQQFEVFAEAISRLRDPADRARLAVDVFGRAGADLLPMMERGAAGVRKLRQESVELGAAMSDDQVERLQKIDGEVKKLSASFASLATTLLAKASPALTGFMDTLRVQLAGTQIEKVRGEIASLERLLATNGGRARFGGLQARVDALRAEERRLKEFATPPKSLAETRGARPLEIGAATVGAGTAGSGKGNETTALDRWLAGREGAGSGMAGPGDATRTVMRNGQLVSESAGQAAGMDALGNEVQLEAIRQMNERKLELDDEYTGQMMDRARLRGESLVSIFQATAEQEQIIEAAKQQNIGSLANMGVSLAIDALGRQSKAGKAFGIAQATISALVGAVNAFRDVPYPLNFAASAMVLAAGMANVQRIRSVSADGSGGGGGGSVGGGGVGIAQGGAVADRVGATAPQEVQARPQATIIINGPVMGGRESAEWIIEQLRDAVAERDVVLIPSNSRQALELAGAGT